MWLAKQRMPYYITIKHMLNEIIKRIKVTSRDVIIRESHMEDKYETKTDELANKAQNLTDYLPKSRGSLSKMPRVGLA